MTAQARARLAGVQAAFWAHPLPEGGGTQLDYFLVGEDFLGGDGVDRRERFRMAAEEHDAQVVALDGLGTRLIAPLFASAAPALAERRAALRRATGLWVPPSRALYVCPQSAVKLGPAMDAALGALLAADAAGTVALLEGAGAQWSTPTARRLRRLLGPARAQRVVILPRLSTEDYVTLLSAASTALDSFPYSGFTTSAELLAMRVPVVALEAAAAPAERAAGTPEPSVRGSQTAALLRRAGLGQKVARSTEQWVQRAQAAAAAQHRRLHAPLGALNGDNHSDADDAGGTGGASAGGGGDGADGGDADGGDALQRAARQLFDGDDDNGNGDDAASAWLRWMQRAVRQAA